MVNDVRVIKGMRAVEAIGRIWDIMDRVPVRLS